MTCSISIEERDEYLFIVVTDDNTPEYLKTYATEYPRRSSRRKMRVLVVVRLQGPELSRLEVFKGVSTGSDRAAGFGMRVAYVYENLAHSSDSMLLAETWRMGAAFRCAHSAVLRKRRRG